MSKTKAFDARKATDEELVAEQERIDALRIELKEEGRGIKEEINRRGTESQIVSRLSSGQILPEDQERYVRDLDADGKTALTKKVEAALKEKVNRAGILIAKMKT